MFAYEDKFETRESSEGSAVLITDPDKIRFISSDIVRCLGKEAQDIIGSSPRFLLKYIVDKEARAYFVKRLEYIFSGSDSCFTVPLIGEGQTPLRLTIRRLPFGTENTVLGILYDPGSFPDADKTVRTLNAKIGELKSLLTEIHERQFALIVRHLHDVIGQDIVAIKYRIEKLILEKGNLIGEELAHLMMVISRLHENNRQLISRFSPHVINEQGFRNSLESYLAEFSCFTDLECELSVKGEAYEPEDIISTNLYRIFQELLMNAHKHSGGSRLETILIFQPDKIMLTVADDGRGLGFGARSGKKPVGGGTGLKNIGDRLKIIDGRIETESANKKGTRISITVPRGERTREKNKNHDR